MRGRSSAPCDRGTSRAADLPRGVTARSIRLPERVCEALPGARAPCNGGFARPTTRTQRLPALHCRSIGRTRRISTDAKRAPAVTQRTRRPVFALPVYIPTIGSQQELPATYSRLLFIFVPVQPRLAWAKRARFTSREQQMSFNPYYATPPKIKRRVFVSYHHGGDQSFYDTFVRHFADTYELIMDNSLERKVQSDNVEYVMRNIRENYVTGSSCTIVLCGLQTPNRKFVDWEIAATLDKKHGLIGLKLPTLHVINNGCSKPDRLQDNLDSGYAKWSWWESIISNPTALASLIESANAQATTLIDNSRSLRTRNS